MYIYICFPSLFQCTLHIGGLDVREKWETGAICFCLVDGVAMCLGFFEAITKICQL